MGTLHDAEQTLRAGNARLLQDVHVRCHRRLRQAERGAVRPRRLHPSGCADGTVGSHRPQLSQPGPRPRCRRQAPQRLTLVLRPSHALRSPQAAAVLAVAPVGRRPRPAAQGSQRRRPLGLLHLRHRLDGRRGCGLFQKERQGAVSRMFPRHVPHPCQERSPHACGDRVGTSPRVGFPRRDVDDVPLRPLVPAGQRPREVRRADEPLEEDDRRTPQPPQCGALVGTRRMVHAAFSESRQSIRGEASTIIRSSYRRIAWTSSNTTWRSTPIRKSIGA